jgi:hypothetical protein
MSQQCTHTSLPWRTPFQGHGACSLLSHSLLLTCSCSPLGTATGIHLLPTSCIRDSQSKTSTPGVGGCLPPSHSPPACLPAAGYVHGGTTPSLTPGAFRVCHPSSCGVRRVDVPVLCWGCVGWLFCSCRGAGWGLASVAMCCGSLRGVACLEAAACGWQVGPYHIMGRLRHSRCMVRYNALQGNGRYVTGKLLSARRASPPG